MYINWYMKGVTVGSLWVFVVVVVLVDWLVLVCREGGFVFWFVCFFFCLLVCLCQLNTAEFSGKRILN